MTGKDLGPIDWAVLHAAQDMDRRGVYPTGDLLCDCSELEDVPDSTVRRVRRDLAAAGVLAPVSPDTRGESDRVEPDPGDDDPGDVPVVLPLTRTPADTSSRAFNLALYRLSEDKGSLLRNLSVITGLSENALKKRVQRTRFDYDDDADGEFTGLDPVEQRYYSKMYRSHHDPAVRQWAADNAAPLRRRPDCRSARDRAADSPAA